MLLQKSETPLSWIWKLWMKSPWGIYHLSPSFPNHPPQRNTRIYNFMTSQVRERQRQRARESCWWVWGSSIQWYCSGTERSWIERRLYRKYTNIQEWLCSTVAEKWFFCEPETPCSFISTSSLLQSGWLRSITVHRLNQFIFTLLWMHIFFSLRWNKFLPPSKKTLSLLRKTRFFSWSTSNHTNKPFHSV